MTVVEQTAAPKPPRVRRRSDMSDEEAAHHHHTSSQQHQSVPSTSQAPGASSVNEVELSAAAAEGGGLGDRSWDNRLVISYANTELEGIDVALLSKRGYDSMMAAGISKHELKQLGIQVEGVIDHPGGFNSWFTAGLAEEHLFATNMLALDMPRLRAYLDTHLQRIPTENCRVFYSHKTVAVMSGSATREVAIQDLSAPAPSPEAIADNIYHVPYDLLINAEGCNSTLRDLMDVEGESAHTTYGVKWFGLDEVKEASAPCAKGIPNEEELLATNADSARNALLRARWSLERNRIHRWTYPCPFNTGNTITLIAFPRSDSAITNNTDDGATPPTLLRSSFSVMAYMPIEMLERLTDAEILERYLSDIATEHVVQQGEAPQKKGGDFNQEDFEPLVSARGPVGTSSTHHRVVREAEFTITSNFELQTFIPRGVPRKDVVRPFPIVFCEELTNGNGYSTAVVVGDAAHTAHPFLQQNLNLALEDCAALVNQTDGITRNFFEALKQYSIERGVAGDSLRLICERSLYYNRSKHRNLLLRLRNRYAAFIHGVFPRRYNHLYEGSPNQLYGRSVEWMLNGRGYSPYERIEANQSRHHRWYHFTRYFV